MQKMQLKKILTLYGIDSFDLLDDNELYGSPNREISRLLIKSKGKFILRKYLKIKKKILRNRAELYEFFAKNHFPHIEFLPLISGKKILEEDNYLYTLEQYIENRPIIRPQYIKELDYAEKIGELYNKFINIPQLKTFYDKHFKKTNIVEKIKYYLRDIQLKNHEIYELFIADFQNIINFLGKVPIEYVPIHGDLHPMNILFGEKTTYLIDWEFTGIGINNYDLGLCAGCIFADSPNNEGITFIKRILTFSNAKSTLSEILIIAYISRLLWIIEWIKAKDIEALKWEKYVLFALLKYLD